MLTWAGGQVIYGSCIDQTKMKIDMRQPEECKLQEVEFITPERDCLAIVELIWVLLGKVPSIITELRGH